MISAGQERLKRLFLLTVCTVLLFLMGFWSIGFKPMPVTSLGHALNDQVGYVSGGRALVEGGQINTHWILPSTLGQKTKTQVLYVPGHYYAMAVAFKLFGYHPWAELIPSLLGFILLVCGVYLIAENLFGKDSALGSAVIVLFFPYLLLFSLTSMAELTVLASAVTAFVFCLWVPRSWVSILGPVFILSAVCFRETSILIVLPLLGVLWNRIDSSKKWQNLGVLSLTLVAGCYLLFRGPLGGRPGLMAAQMFGGFNELYSDATFTQSFHASVGQWIQALIQRWVDNVILLFHLRPLTFEVAVTKSLVFMSVAILIWGALKRSCFEMTVGLMGVVLCEVQMAIYTPASFRATRVFLLLSPFIAIVVGNGVHHLRVKKLGKILGLSVFALISLKCGWFNIASRVPKERAQEQKVVQFVNDLDPDKHKTLIGPFWLVSPWVKENYPADWSFLPANRETFRLLEESHPVGMILLHDSERAVMPLSVLQELGYSLLKETLFQGEKYFVLTLDRRTGAK